MLAILGIFGKKEKFYAQVDDNDTTSTAVEEVEIAPAIAEAVVEEVAETAPTVAKTSKKTSVKKSKKGGTTTATAPTTTVVSKRSRVNEPFWVKAMENTRNYMSNAQKQPEMTFSTDYLLHQSGNSRRRPGPSLNPFLGMARQMGGRGSI